MAEVNDRAFPNGKPRRGKIEVEAVREEDYRTESGVVTPGGNHDIYTPKARVVAMGDPPDEMGWDLEVGDIVLLEYHAGRRHQTFDRKGHIRDLWVIDHKEVIYICDSSASG